ncbi:MAG: hypothetical protein WD046_06420 [Paracoccaceae bacterium]
MTALRKFERLEAIGHWRADPDAPLREVVVGFGKATLNITSLKDETLAHWALAALRRIAKDGEASLYAVDDDAAETLLITDPLMVEAIETVTRALNRPRRKRKTSVWKTLVACGLVVAIGLGIAKVPNMLRQQIASNTPPVRAHALSDKLAARLGRHCETVPAARALALLSARLHPNSAPRAIVFIEGAGPALLTLPDGTFVIGRKLIERLATPDALAAEIALAEASGATDDPMRKLLDGLDLWQVMGFLLRGWPDDQALLTALHSAPHGHNPAHAADLLRAARISTAALGIADEATSSPALAPALPPALDDQSWVALQGVCDL